MFSDTYKTIRNPAQAEYKDRNSRFLAFAFNISNDQQCKEVIKQLKKEHPHAAHHCYAYIIGIRGEVQKFNDDREPANTAGRPILRAIMSNNLTEVLIVVVRYFGGKLLGVPGLIEAYGTAAKMAIAKDNIIEIEITEKYLLTVAHEFENDVFKLIKHLQLKVLQHQHADEVSVLIEVRKGRVLELKQAVNDLPHINMTFHQ